MARARRRGGARGDGVYAARACLIDEPELREDVHVARAAVELLVVHVDDERPTTWVDELDGHAVGANVRAEVKRREEDVEARPCLAREIAL